MNLLVKLPMFMSEVVNCFPQHCVVSHLCSQTHLAQSQWAYYIVKPNMNVNVHLKVVLEFRFQSGGWCIFVYSRHHIVCRQTF